MAGLTHKRFIHLSWTAMVQGGGDTPRQPYPIPCPSQPWSKR